MRYIYVSIITIVMLIYLPHIIAEDTIESISADTIGLIYFLPSDRTSQDDIDSNIITLMQQTQTAFGELMEAHEYGSKTFSLQTNDDGVVVHHIKGKFTDAYYESATKWEVWSEIADAGLDPSTNILITFVDLSSENIDGWCGTGGDWHDANGGVVTLPASGACFGESDDTLLTGVNLVAHELGHALGLRHDFRGHSDSSADLTITDGMVSSSCATKWLDGHRYFNSYSNSTTASTQIEISTPSGTADEITFSFTITDADGLHQAHFFITDSSSNSFDDLNLLDCISLDRSGTSETVAFSTSALTANTDSVTLRVMDAVGAMTEKLFPVNLTNIFADVNRDGVVNILDLTLVANKFGTESSGAEDVNGDGSVNILDLTLVANAISSI